MDEKMIRFIDTNRNELFTIPDGGSIVLINPNGNQHILICTYIDEMHFSIDAGVDGNRYHSSDFYEIFVKNGSKVEPEREPEFIAGSYRVTHRFPAGNKIFVMGHSPTSPQPYATWQAYRDSPGKDWGHYWSDGAAAWQDLNKRVRAELTGIPYDHTKLYSREKNRDDAR